MDKVEDDAKYEDGDDRQHCPDFGLHFSGFHCAPKLISRWYVLSGNP